MYIQNISCLGMVSGFVEAGTPHIHFGQKDKGLSSLRALCKLCWMDDLLSRGILTESIRPWASPIVLVPMKAVSLRLCIDYRKLNSIAEPDAYPIPRIDDILDSLSGCSWFTCLDLA